MDGIVRSGQLSAPLTVTWEVTNRCNLRCAHCLSDSSPEADVSGELSLEEAKAVADQLIAARVFQVHFGGGLGHLPARRGPDRRHAPHLRQPGGKESPCS